MQQTNEQEKDDYRHAHSSRVNIVAEFMKTVDDTFMATLMSLYSHIKRHGGSNT